MTLKFGDTKVVYLATSEKFEGLFKIATLTPPCFSFFRYLIQLKIGKALVVKRCRKTLS